MGDICFCVSLVSPIHYYFTVLCLVLRITTKRDNIEGNLLQNKRRLLRAKTLKQKKYLIYFYFPDGPPPYMSHLLFAIH